MIEELLWWLLGCVTGLGLGVRLHIWATRNPYRYICPKDGCDFSCSGTEIDLVDRLAAGHENYHEEKT